MCLIYLQEEVALAKEEWELSRLKALKEEEERRAELEEDEMLFTYSREDANNQVKNKRAYSSGKKHRGPFLPKASKMKERMVPMGLMDKYELEAETASPELRKRGRGRRSNAEIVASNSQVSEIGDEHLARKKPAGEAEHVSKSNTVSGLLKKDKVPKSDTVTSKQARLKTTPKKEKTPQKDVLLRTPPKRNKITMIKNPQKNKALKSKVNSVSPMKSPGQSPPQPWSNPNLVIRTRKASTKSAPDSPEGDLVKEGSEEVDVVSLSPSSRRAGVHNTSVAIKPVLSKLKANLANVGAALAQVQSTSQHQIVLQQNPVSQSQPTISYLRNIQGPNMSLVKNLATSSGVIRGVQFAPGKVQNLGNVQFNSLSNVVSASHNPQFISAQVQRQNVSTLQQQKSSNSQPLPILEKMAMQLSNSSKPIQQITSKTVGSILQGVGGVKPIHKTIQLSNPAVSQSNVIQMGKGVGSLPPGVQIMQTARPAAQQSATLGGRTIQQLIQKGMVDGHRVVQTNRVVQPQRVAQTVVQQGVRPNSVTIVHPTNNTGVVNHPQTIVQQPQANVVNQTLSSSSPGIQIGNQIIRLQNLPAVPNQIIQLKTSSGQQQFIQIRQVLPSQRSGGASGAGAVLGQRGGVMQVQRGNTGSPQTMVINKPSGLVLAKPPQQSPRTVLHSNIPQSLAGNTVIQVPKVVNTVSTVVPNVNVNSDDSSETSTVVIE